MNFNKIKVESMGAVGFSDKIKIKDIGFTVPMNGEIYKYNPNIAISHSDYHRIIMYALRSIISRDIGVDPVYYFEENNLMKYFEKEEK